MENLSFEIRAELKNLNRSLDKASANIESFSKKNEARFKKFGQSATRVGKQLTVGLSAPLALLAGNAVRTFATFDDQMRKVGATMGATTDDLQAMTEVAKELGSTTRFTARQAAEGLEFMALAGFDAKQSIEAIPDVLNLAAAAAIDLGLASDIVTDTMSAFSLSADQAANVSDVLAKTQASANATVVQLGESFKFSTANAATFGQDLETLAATLGVFADSGVKGSRAGTAFNAIIRDLKRSAEDGAVAIGGQNIALADSEGNFRDLLDIMTDVEKATSSLSQAQQANALDAVFQEESIRGVNILMTQGVSKAEALRKKLYEAGGSAQAMAEQMEGGLGGAMRSLNAAFEGFNIELGQVLAPVINKLAGLLGKLLNYFKDLSPTTKKIIVVVAGLAAAAGPLLLALGGIATVLPAILSGLAVLTGPIGLIVAGIAALTAVVVANWDTITAWAEDIANYFVKLYNESLIFRAGIEVIVMQFKTMFEVGKFVFNSLWTIIKTNIALIKDAFTGLGGLILGVLTFDRAQIRKSLDTLAKDVAQTGGAALSKLSNEAKTLFDNIGQDANEMINNILRGEKAPVKFNASEESKTNLKEDVANAVEQGAKEGLGRAKIASVASGLESQGATQMSGDPVGQQITPEALREKLGGLSQEFLNFNQDLNGIISGNISQTLSNLGTAIGDAIAQGTSITDAIGQTLIQGFAGFLSELGDLLIQYGAFAKIKGALDQAIAAGGPAAIAAGIAAVAVGVTLKGIASSIGNRAQSGFSGSTGASAQSSVGQNTQVNTVTTDREIILRARGRDLVAVLNNERNFGNIVGG